MPLRHSRGGKRAEQLGVAQHRGRLPEGADEVLALGQVHARLAADRGVDHPEQRGRDVHDGMPRWYTAAANPPTSVTSPPPTATTQSARVSPHCVNSLHSSSTVASDFAVLARADREHLVLDAGIDVDADLRLRHDRDLAARPSGSTAASSCRAPGPTSTS